LEISKFVNEKSIQYKNKTVYGLIKKKKAIYLYQKNKKIKLLDFKEKDYDLYPGLFFTSGVEVKLVHPKEIGEDDENEDIKDEEIKIEDNSKDKEIKKEDIKDEDKKDEEIKDLTGLDKNEDNTKDEIKKDDKKEEEEIKNKEKNEEERKEDKNNEEKKENVKTNNEEEEEQEEYYKIKKKYSSEYKKKGGKYTMNTKIRNDELRTQFTSLLFEKQNKIFVKIYNKMENEDQQLIFGFVEKNFKRVLEIEESIDSGGENKIGKNGCG
jgi:hypothetical protein